MRILNNKWLRLWGRKAYFAVFNSWFFDRLNRVYFRFFWAKHRDGILRGCSLTDDLAGEKILILAPHCDDETIGCGGAMLRYVEKKKEVFLVYLTDSQKQGSRENPEGIREERRQEAYALAGALGLPKENLFFLGGADGDLLHSPVEGALAEVIRSVRPDTIFLPVVLDTHPDHYAVTPMLDAVYQVEPELLRGVRLYLYESQSPLTLFYANVALRITKMFQQKLELFRLFRSQPYSFKFVGNLNQINGLFWGSGELCETYLAVPMERYHEFTLKYFNEDEAYFRHKELFKANKHSGSLIESYLSSYRTKGILRELR